MHIKVTEEKSRNKGIKGGGKNMKEFVSVSVRRDTVINIDDT